MKFYAFLFFLILGIELKSQVIEQAEFELGVIQWELDEHSPSDSAMALLVVDRFTSSMGATLIFDDEYIVVVRKDEYGDIIKREVFNMTDSISYKFGYEKGLKFYKVDSSWSSITDREKLKAEVLDRENLSEKMFGLSQEKITIRVAGEEEVKLVTTPDVKISTYSRFPLFPFDVEAFILKLFIEMDGLTVVFGVTQFSEKILHPEWLSTSLEGFESADEFLDDLQGLAESLASDDEAKKGKGTNLDIVERLVSDGYIEQDYYGLDNYRRLNASFDIPSILQLLQREGSGIPVNQPVDSMLQFLSAYKLLSPTVEQALLKHEREKSSSDSYDLWTLMLCASIKDHLDKQEVRATIKRNLETKGFLSEDQAIVSAKYLNGEIELSEYLLSSRYLSELSSDTIRSTEDLVKQVRWVYSEALGRDLEGVEVYEANNNIVINDQEQVYEISINTLKEIDYDKTDFDTEPAKYEYLDFIVANEHFYLTLLEKAKQIAADNNLPYAYGVLRFDQLFNSHLKSDRYEDIIVHFPELQFFKHQYALQRFPKGDYPLSGVATSFEENEGRADEQLMIGSALLGNIDVAVDFITTDKKKEYLDYLTVNKDRYSISDDRLDQISEYVLGNLLRDPFDLIGKIPNISVTVSSLFPSKPVVSSSNNAFKDVFPGLDKFLKGDIVAEGFEYNREGDYLNFIYNGKRHEVLPTEKDMLEKATSLLRAQKGHERDVYTYFGIPTSTKTHYYLTLEEKKVLQDMFDIRFIPSFR